MPDAIDQPGKLYVGRFVEPEAPPTPGAAQAELSPAFLSLRELTTHAVILGMTGTGKTGLGIAMLEEALLQNIPCVIVDPKGDITNLALNFPQLRGDDFKPWLDADDAQRAGLTLDALAARTAKTWRDGLAESGIGTDRLARLADRADVRIYTPGSSAGIAVNILQSFSPPPESQLNWAADAEVLRERIAQIVAAILGLIGIESDTLNSREHILLATIFEFTWRAGQAIDLPSLIRMTQDPPVQRLGALDLNAFFPRADRAQLAMRLNNLAASPSFDLWRSGRPLDLAELTSPNRDAGGTNPAGKTRASIFYLAHLDDAQRQFFVTLLLSQLVLWMRAQAGTSTLRCLTYFDEVFGYCPPFPRNPPTKAPLMTLIKQGRAAGLGVVLATQNPADLDYKGLSNIGTWLIGRLRTGRDRDRALEGLEGAGVGFERVEFEGALATLPPRTFLLQTTSGTPRFITSRWAMSYLRGPMTREQIEALNADDRARNAEREAREAEASPTRADFQFSIQDAPPPSPPADVPQTFLMMRPPRGKVRYRPFLLVSANVRFSDRASNVNGTQRYTRLLPLDAAVRALDFDAAEPLPEFNLGDGQPMPVAGASFAERPVGVNARWLKAASRAFVEFLYRSAHLRIWFNSALKLYGQPGEDALAFRVRCEQAAERARADEAVELRAKYSRKMADAQAKLTREQRELEAGRAELNLRQREQLLTNAESVFNLLTGRRSLTSVSRGASKDRLKQQTELDVRSSEASVAELTDSLKRIADEYVAELKVLNTAWSRALDETREIRLTPSKADIFPDAVVVAWVFE